MKPMDYMKAAGLAFLVIVVTMALSFPMVFAYATFVEPGRPQAFYNEAALWIAPWSSHIFGPVLFFGLNYLMARRRPERNALAFAAATIILYVLIDFGLLGLATGSVGGLLTLVVAMSMAGKIAAAFLGALLGSRRTRAATA